MAIWRTAVRAGIKETGIAVWVCATRVAVPVEKVCPAQWGVRPLRVGSLDVGFFEAVVLDAVFAQEHDGEDDGAQAEEGEDAHGDGVVIAGDAALRVGLCGKVVDDPPDEGGHEGEPDVLYVEDERIGRAELFHGDDFRNGGPQGAGHEGKGDAQNDHHDDGEPPDLEQGQGEEHVDHRQEHRADNHERGAAADAVVECAEEGREEDGAEGQHGGDEPGQAFGHGILVDHQLGGKLDEGEHAGVEHETEQRDEPEALAGEDDAEVFQLEALFFFAADGLYGSGGVFFLVHDAEHEVGNQTDAERQHAD